MSANICFQIYSLVSPCSNRTSNRFTMASFLSTGDPYPAVAAVLDRTSRCPCTLDKDSVDQDADEENFSKSSRLQEERSGIMRCDAHRRHNTDQSPSKELTPSRHRKEPFELWSMNCAQYSDKCNYPYEQRLKSTQGIIFKTAKDVAIAWLPIPFKLGPAI